jgi:hypothetical protein
MDRTEGSETSENHNLTPGKYPKEHIQYVIQVNRGLKKSLIIRIITKTVTMTYVLVMMVMLICHVEVTFLGAFRKSRKATCLSVHPLVTARLPMDGFS